MEKSHKIALLGAGLLIGAQVGATVLTESPDVALQEPIPTEIQADGPSTPEIADAPTIPETAPELVAAAEQPILPVTPRQVEPQDTPPWGEDYRRMLPALAEYLDRTEHLRVTGAPGGAFPSDGERMLPSLAAYFDERAATLIAQTQPAVVVASEAAVREPVAGEPVAAVATPAPASGSEVTVVEARSPVATGTPF